GGAGAYHSTLGAARLGCGDAPSSSTPQRPDGGCALCIRVCELCPRSLPSRLVWRSARLLSAAFPEHASLITASPPARGAVRRQVLRARILGCHHPHGALFPSRSCAQHRSPGLPPLVEYFGVAEVVDDPVRQRDHRRGLRPHLRDTSIGVYDPLGVVRDTHWSRDDSPDVASVSTLRPLPTTRADAPQLRVPGRWP